MATILLQLLAKRCRHLTTLEGIVPCLQPVRAPAPLIPSRTPSTNVLAILGTFLFLPSQLAAHVAICRLWALKLTKTADGTSHTHMPKYQRSLWSWECCRASCTEARLRFYTPGGAVQEKFPFRDDTFWYYWGIRVQETDCFELYCELSSRNVHWKAIDPASQRGQAG